MKEINIQDYNNIVENSVIKDLKIITSIVYTYDIKKITDGLGNLSVKSQNKVLEYGINEYLKKIQLKQIKYAQYMVMQKDIEDILDFYTDEDNFETCEAGVGIASDLVLKLIGRNRRNLTLPISIDNIIEYSIHSSFSKKDVYLEILYLYLYLAVFCYLLETKDYSKQIKEFSEKNYEGNYNYKQFRIQ